MKLICYPVTTPLPSIRPAVTERDWMDQTSERHAYRCLPLSIANAAGWEILNPSSFSAVWDGGPGPDAVRIISEDGTDPIGISLFGAGVLTFHVTGLFETEKNIQMWVSGSPNRVKDAIQPLTGIVETEWSPYTFTMNWKFTRTGQRVRFEKDEPFCFVMPISLDMLEGVEPEFRAMEANPELKEGFFEWSKSRSSFNADLQDPSSEAAGQKWQKTYHHGAGPDGKKTEARHRTKVRLRNFSNPHEGDA